MAGRSPARTSSAVAPSAIAQRGPPASPSLRPSSACRTGVAPGGRGAPQDRRIRADDDDRLESRRPRRPPGSSGRAGRATRAWRSSASSGSPRRDLAPSSERTGTIATRRDRSAPRDRGHARHRSAAAGRAAGSAAGAEPPAKSSMSRARRARAASSVMTRVGDERAHPERLDRRARGRRRRRRGRTRRPGRRRAGRRRARSTRGRARRASGRPGP